MKQTRKTALVTLFLSLVAFFGLQYFNVGMTEAQANCTDAANLCADGNRLNLTALGVYGMVGLMSAGSAVTLAVDFIRTGTKH